MGYLALLHARLTGWVRDFGLLAGSIVSFSLVIMAWYGVNFVLGAGLHSYGFGAGGMSMSVASLACIWVYDGYPDYCTGKLEAASFNVSEPLRGGLVLELTY